MPVVMGALAQSHSTPFSYIVPLICFAIVFIFAVHGYKIKTHE
jgi:fucose permease